MNEMTWQGFVCAFSLVLVDSLVYHSDTIGEMNINHISTSYHLNSQQLMLFEIKWKLEMNSLFLN